MNVHFRNFSAKIVREAEKWLLVFAPDQELHAGKVEDQNDSGNDQPRKRRRDLAERYTNPHQAACNPEKHDLLKRKKCTFTQGFAGFGFKNKKFIDKK